MKILAVSDLHSHWVSYSWIEENAGKFDLIIIAGDLADAMDEKRPYLQQVAEIQHRLWSILQNAKCLAVCSGNHDLPMGTRTFWLNDLAPSKGVFIGDSQQKVILGEAPFCVKCLPWYFDDREYQTFKSLLRDKSQSNGLPEIWVAHDPPDKCQVSFAGGDFHGNSPFTEFILEESPAFVFSGHVHGAPFDGGQWAAKLGKTWCFNPGRTMENGKLVVPRIELDLVKRTADWFAGNVHQTIELK